MKTSVESYPNGALVVETFVDNDSDNYTRALTVYLADIYLAQCRDGHYLHIKGGCGFRVTAETYKEIQALMCGDGLTLQAPDPVPPEPR
jgi:hypothetical protein